MLDTLGLRVRGSKGLGYGVAIESNKINEFDVSCRQALSLAVSRCVNEVTR